jgi:hypothetical protein
MWLEKTPPSSIAPLNTQASQWSHFILLFYPHLPPLKQSLSSHSIVRSFRPLYLHDCVRCRRSCSDAPPFLQFLFPKKTRPLAPKVLPRRRLRRDGRQRSNSCFSPNNNTLLKSPNTRTSQSTSQGSGRSRHTDTSHTKPGNAETCKKDPTDNQVG